MCTVEINHGLGKHIELLSTDQLRHQVLVSWSCLALSLSISIIINTWFSNRVFGLVYFSMRCLWPLPKYQYLWDISTFSLIPMYS
jgi:hypothetical protein